MSSVAATAATAVAVVALLGAAAGGDGVLLTAVRAQLPTNCTGFACVGLGAECGPGFSGFPKCAQGLRCNATASSALGGVCVARVALGEACVLGVDACWAPGATVVEQGGPRCVNESLLSPAQQQQQMPSPTGARCAFASYREPGEPCGADIECSGLGPRNGTCGSDGRCVSVPLGGACSAVLGLSDCDNTAELYCGSGGTCVAKKAVGASCSGTFRSANDVECADGNTCYGGTCQVRQSSALGAACAIANVADPVCSSLWCGNSSTCQPMPVDAWAGPAGSCEFRNASTCTASSLGAVDCLCDQVSTPRGRCIVVPLAQQLLQAVAAGNGCTAQHAAVSSCLTAGGAPGTPRDCVCQTTELHRCMSEQAYNVQRIGGTAPQVSACRGLAATSTDFPGLCASTSGTASTGAAGTGGGSPSTPPPPPSGGNASPVSAGTKEHKHTVALLTAAGTLSLLALTAELAQ